MVKKTFSEIRLVLMYVHVDVYVCMDAWIIEFLSWSAGMPENHVTLDIQGLLHLDVMKTYLVMKRELARYSYS
jgi:hypothetical protein